MGEGHFYLTVREPAQDSGLDPVFDRLTDDVSVPVGDPKVGIFVGLPSLWVEIHGKSIGISTGVVGLEEAFTHFVKDVAQGEVLRV
jgi:hypothetical protein